MSVAQARTRKSADAQRVARRATDSPVGRQTGRPAPWRGEGRRGNGDSLPRVPSALKHSHTPSCRGGETKSRYTKHGPLGPPLAA